MVSGELLVGDGGLEGVTGYADASGDEAFDKAAGGPMTKRLAGLDRKRRLPPGSLFQGAGGSFEGAYFSADSWLGFRWILQRCLVFCPRDAPSAPSWLVAVCWTLPSRLWFAGEARPLRAG